MTIWHRIRSTAGDAGAVVFGEAFARLASFLAIPIAAIFLSDSELGRVALGLLAYTLVLLLFDFGLGGALTKLYFDNDEGHGSIWWLLFLVLGIGIPVVLLIGPWVTDLFVDSIDFYPTIAPAVFAAAGSVIVTLGQATLRAQFRFKEFSTLSIGRALATTVPAVVAVIITPTATAFFTGMAIGLVGLGVLTLFAFRRAIGRPSSAQWNAALLFGLPLVPHLLFGVLINAADRVLIDRWLGIADVGRYSLAYQLAWAGGALALALNNMLAPALYRRSANRGVEAGDLLLRAISRTAVASAIVIATLVAFVAPVIYSVLRESATPDATLFIAVGAASVVFAAYLLAVGPYFTRAMTWAIPIMTGAGAVSNLVGNWALIPRMGINGAAVATFIGYAVTLVLLIIGAVYFGFAKPFVRRMTALAALLIVAGSLAIAIGSIYAVVVAVLAGAAVTPGALRDIRTARAEWVSAEGT